MSVLSTCRERPGRAGLAQSEVDAKRRHRSVAQHRPCRRTAESTRGESGRTDRLPSRWCRRRCSRTDRSPAQSPEPHEPLQLSTASIASDESVLLVQKLLSVWPSVARSSSWMSQRLKPYCEPAAPGHLAPERRGIDGEVILEPLPVVRQRHRGMSQRGPVLAERERALDLGLDQAGLEGIRAVRTAGPA